MNKTILDMCCGSRMFWFNRADPRAVFVDIRAESHTLCDGRKLEIAPDLIADFRQLPFADDTFQIVVFDPPHLTHCGPEGWQGKKYGILSKSWKDDLTKGFAEAFRVLRPGGVLIFKWNEVHIPTRDIIKLSPVPPIFGHPSGKRANTNWVCFQKPGENLMAQLEQELHMKEFINDDVHLFKLTLLWPDGHLINQMAHALIERNAELLSLREQLAELKQQKPIGQVISCNGNKTLGWINDAPVGTLLFTSAKPAEIPRHIYSMLVNELRDVPAIGCKRELIIGVLNRHGVTSKPVGG